MLEELYINKKLVLNTLNILAINGVRRTDVLYGILSDEDLDVIICLNLSITLNMIIFRTLC